MEYEMRKLVATDMGTVCKILSEIGASKFSDCIELKDLKNVKNIEKVGLSVVLDAVGIIMDNFVNAEKTIIPFLASLTGKSVKELQELPFADYGELILAVVMKEEFRDFFGRAMKLLHR